MNYSLYSLKTLFNTHVGSGQSSYGIVDNIVQKELLSKYPCINSTSLKGALREWVKVALDKPNEAVAIFGQENENKKGREDANKKNKAGTHHFFQAQLLSFPMRSDKVQYFNVTCPSIISVFQTQLNNFGITKYDEALTILNVNPSEGTPKSLIGTTGAAVEFHNLKTIAAQALKNEVIQKLFGENIVIMHDNDFNKIIKKLPVITRNHLENGQSTNLFYEEVVPRETHFAFLIGTKELDTSFDKIIDESKLLQIGANATVGYGFCKLQNVK